MKGTLVKVIAGGIILSSIPQMGVHDPEVKASGSKIQSTESLTGDDFTLITQKVSSSGRKETDLEEVQKNLQKLGYYAVQTMTGNYDSPTKEAIRDFQSDYGLTITGTANEQSRKAIEHAVVKQNLITDTKNYLGVPYVWGGTTPSGFDCSGFVYYMFNKHGVDMPRDTSAGLYTKGEFVSQPELQPGDLVFYSVDSDEVTHVGFYIGKNEWISATSSKGIAIYSLGNSYWSDYYEGAKRIY
ncbi:C40 family peptidase [Virgibacillus sp. MSP4-1]|uniref:C40 family peptidase n=1 Tax=Virgibacillus sp. MSP4-1 TaxID=2700081 RepID=UPI00039B6507|nr:C40 family peptidase [Virgibacillus sp. MSP4-1]